MTPEPLTRTALPGDAGLWDDGLLVRRRPRDPSVLELVMTVPRSAVPILPLLLLAALAACGGAVAENASPRAATPAIQIRPATASLQPQDSATFAAAVTGLTSTAVTWSIDEPASSGTVTQAGVYTAPSGTGTFHVRARSVAAPAVSGFATVTVETTPPPASDLPAQLAVLQGKAVYMVHESVGYNILGGLQRLLDANGGTEPTISSDTSNPMDVNPGVFAQQYFPNIGDGSAHNGQPVAKVQAFHSVLDAGIGAKANIAFMKFCFADFDNLTDDAWVQSAFSTYRSTMAHLAATYPNVKFVYLTVPYYQNMNDAGFAVGNVRREQMSDLIRANFPATRVFDIALLESTDPSNARVFDVMSSAGIRPHAMYPGYTTDGGHLTDAFANDVATKLVAFLANLN